MNRNRKLLGLVPFVLAYFPADDVSTYLVGLGLIGLFYWTAWWLSDGFASITVGESQYQYQNGPQGYGLYFGEQRIHR